MARCGCASALCTCQIQGDGSLVDVTGAGSPTSPYIVEVQPTQVTVKDSTSVGMTITGDGTPTAPYEIQAIALINGYKVLSGVASVTPIAANGSPTTFHVTFPTPTPFTVNPVVLASIKIGNPQNWSPASVINESTTGFDIVVTRLSGSTTPLSVGWHAMGK